MANLTIEKGFYSKRRGKEYWSKDQEGEHFLIKKEGGKPLIVSVHNPIEIMKAIKNITKNQKSETLEELIINARKKGIVYFQNLLEEVWNEVLEDWKDEPDMIEGIKEDHQRYQAFFHELLEKKREEHALELWRKMDTAPRETLLQWLKEANDMFIK